MNNPHGGRLMIRSRASKDQGEVAKLQGTNSVLKIGKNQIQDVANIARGAFSSLKLFLISKERSVVLLTNVTN